MIDWDKIGKEIDRFISKKRISIQSFADEARLNRRTIDRIMHGESGNITTLKKIEIAIGKKFIVDKDLDNIQHIEVAPKKFGEYTLSSVKSYIGNYYTFRYSFDYDDGIVCAYIKVYWDYDQGGLRFEEKQRNTSRQGEKYGYDFGGHVTIPPETGVIQFVIENNGLHRITTLKSIQRKENSCMRGLLLTINEIEDIGFYPVTTPILFIKDVEEENIDTINQNIGSFKTHDIWKKDVVDELSKISKKFIVTTS